MDPKKWEALNDRERKLYRLIKENPYVTQQELAEALSLSRPSVANLISGLVKKGYILGKAYILNESEQVVCIGGANVDRKYYVKGKLQPRTSNPVRSTQSVGGVARNIAENLGRIGMDVTLLTASGADSDWSFIKSTSSPYMNLDYVTQFQDEATGSYTAILDESGDMTVALADMDVYDLITPDLLEKQVALLSHARCIMADLNCPKETLQWLSHFAKKQAIPLVLVTVSAPKMDRLPDDLSGVTWLITNREESEAYFQKEIAGKSAWQSAVGKWLALGVFNVVITNGKQGAMIGNKEEGIHHVPAAIESHDVIDVTGAGDAFSSAVIYTWLEGKPLIDIAKAGIINATKTLQSSYTVRQDLSADQLQKDMEEF